MGNEGVADVNDSPVETVTRKMTNENLILRSNHNDPGVWEESVNEFDHDGNAIDCVHR